MAKLKISETEMEERVNYLAQYFRQHILYRQDQSTKDVLGFWNEINYTMTIEIVDYYLNYLNAKEYSVFWIRVVISYNVLKSLCLSITSKKLLLSFHFSFGVK